MITACGQSLLHSWHIAASELERFLVYNEDNLLLWISTALLFGCSLLVCFGPNFADTEQTVAPARPFVPIRDASVGCTDDRFDPTSAANDDDADREASEDASIDVSLCSLPKARSITPSASTSSASSDDENEAVDGEFDDDSSSDETVVPSAAGQRLFIQDSMREYIETQLDLDDGAKTRLLIAFGSLLEHLRPPLPPFRLIVERLAQCLQIDQRLRWRRQPLRHSSLTSPYQERIADTQRAALDRAIGNLDAQELYDEEITLF